MKNFIKKAGIILFTLMLVVANMGIFAAAEETGTRKTEGKLTNIQMSIAGYPYGILIHKVDKNGGEALSGSAFKGYQTDETWDLETAVPMRNHLGNEYQVYPDQDTGAVDVDNPAHLFFALWHRRSWMMTEYYVLQEVVSPDGYEHETGKLYYLMLEYDPTDPSEGLTIKIAPQSQDDAYISDDNKYIVLENTKPTPDDPAEEPEELTPEDPKSEEPVEEPNEILTETPVDDSKKPEPPGKEEPTADNTTDSALPKTSDFNIAFFVTAFVLSGAVIGILWICKVRKKDSV